MSKKAKLETLIKVKTQLAEKCERLIKTVKSKPQKKTLQFQAKRFRDQVKLYTQMHAQAE